MEGNANLASMSIVRPKLIRAFSSPSRAVVQYSEQPLSNWELPSVIPIVERARSDVQILLKESN